MTISIEEYSEMINTKESLEEQISELEEKISELEGQIQESYAQGFDEGKYQGHEEGMSDARDEEQEYVNDYFKPFLKLVGEIDNYGCEENKEKLISYIANNVTTLCSLPTSETDIKHIRTI